MFSKDDETTSKKTQIHMKERGYNTQPRNINMAME